MRLTFVNRIRFLVIAMSLGMGLAALLAFQILARKQAAEATHRDLETVSAQLSAFIGDRTELVSALTKVSATNSHLRFLAVTDKATVGDQMESLRDTVGVVDGLSITDRDGKVLGEIGFREKTDVAVDHRTQDALKGEGGFGVIYRGGDVVLTSAEPLRIGDFVQGTFSTFVRLGPERVKQIKGSASYELAFVHDGQVTAGTVPLRDVGDHTDGNPWTADVGGKRYLAYYARISQSDPADRLGFVVLRNEEETLAPYRAFAGTFLLVLVVVSAGALLGGNAFAKSISGTIIRLVDHTARLRDGEWPESLPETRNDELGRLESTFNSMAANLRATQDRLLSMIDIDPLTGLDNHRRLRERLAQEAARTGPKHRLAMMLVDIDDFHEFNVRFGHASGDAKLREVAEAVRHAVPEVAFAGRFSGDQFAVVLPGGTVEDLERIYGEVERFVGDVTISAGAAELRSAKGRVDGLVVAAEMALTRAKELGKGKFGDFGAVPGAEESDPIHLHRLVKNGTYATIRALAAAVDAKDPYTHGHSERVADLAVKLADYMGLDAKQRDLVLRAATLHDVGKIGVPDAILQKEGSLNDEERRMMETHSAMGEYIVGKVPQMSELLPGVRHHHERFDGGGYPDGLVGEKIPLVARYLAVADTFDAMTSDRPYRKGLPEEVALAEIDAQAGKQFDPILAKAFTRMRRQQQRVA